MPAPPATFAEFYPYYLGEHRRPGTRVLHFVGTSLFIGLALTAVFTQRWRLLGGGVVAAYAFAWVGHFFVERNRPATFQRPFLSLLGDFRLFWDLLRGKEKFSGPASQ